jgi:uncharacterized OB-fold protein
MAEDASTRERQMAQQASARERQMTQQASARERQMTQGHPRPVPDQNPAPFYEAARRGELRFQRCADCGAFRHYPRPACPRCLSRRYEWERVTGRGTVYTWTVVRGPTLPAFAEKVPYNVVDVLLEEGVHFVSEVLDCPLEEIRAGMAVEATFVALDEEITLVKFVRA